MRQLVELGKNKEKFAAAKTQVIAVFREEQEGEGGLKKIKDKTETSFSLALDNDKKKTARYSTGRGEFTGYVINSNGIITSIFEGNLRNRAKSAELLDAISKAGGSASKADSKNKGGSGSK